jgi:hypothetical protein
MLASLFRRIKSRLTGAKDPAPHFVYLKIPEPLMPLDRDSKYEDPIDAALGERQFCGIDINVTDLEQARGLLRAILVELGAPAGTEIHFSIGDQKLQDELREKDGYSTSAAPSCILASGHSSQ